MNSIFLEFHLPNAATWFYIASLLILSLFLTFRRPLSLRNLDVLSLLLFPPGFLLLQEAHQLQAEIFRLPKESEARDWKTHQAETKTLYAYVWLISVSGYWFIRAWLDVSLQRRPYIPANLNGDGLIVLLFALFLCLGVVAIRRMPDSPPTPGKEPIVLKKVQAGASEIVAVAPGLGNVDSRFWVERSSAMIGHLIVCLALLGIGSLHFQDWASGAASACLYMLMPTTAYTVGQVHHVWPTMFFLLAVLLYRRPTLAGFSLGVAAGSVFFPLLMFPIWLAFYRYRNDTGENSTLRFSAGFAFAFLLSVALTVLVLASSGDFVSHLRVALNLSDWQAWKRPLTESLWTGSHWAYRLPVFIAYVAFVLVTALGPNPRHLGQVIAQMAAITIGVQFWYADQGGVYVGWYLPLVILLIFRPSLRESVPV